MAGAFPARLCLATRNPGKIREILAICAAWPVEWVTFDRVDEELRARWPDVEETGQSYLENALLKARAAAGVLDIPAVADDSGIEVDVLGGQPGFRSARFAGENATDQENLRLLVDRVRAVVSRSPPALSGMPEAGRGSAGGPTARYRCVVACAWPDGRSIWTEATCEGRLVFQPHGSGGFGYDPIFVPNDDVRTMAELSPEQKDAISHRGKALRALGEALAAGP